MRTPIATMPPLWMSAARCSARRAFRRPWTATPSSFAGCRASARSPWSASSRPATRPGWFGIWARSGCSRSTSPMRTRADAWARAIRSMPSWPREPRSPARRPRSPSGPAGSSSRSASCAWCATARSRPRSAAMVQLRDLIVTAPEPLREQLSEGMTIRGKASLCRRLRPATGELELPSQSARFALRSLARRSQTLDEEIAALDEQLKRLVRSAAPRTTALLGISTGHAGQLLVSAGQNIDRLRGESSFAALCGASPIPASSGKTTRHRLNYDGGDRDANRALHLIAVCRLRHCPRTPTRSAGPPKARPSPRSSAVSSATSRARPTTRSPPTSPASAPNSHPLASPRSTAAPARSASPDAGLDIYRNVPLLRTISRPG
jgi:hypothetical protein